MVLEERARASTRAESVESWRLWLGALGGGAAWLGHLVTNYSLEEWFACSSSARDAGRILGLSVDAVALAANATFLVLALGATAAALSCRRRLARADGDAFDRARWMAGAGLVADVMFVAIIVWGFAPPAIFGVCEYAP